ncbi:serine hydrolase [Aquabacter cavernae]|uniref:serine hydrolase n=1 Tax=Aquabacter cavernae TaxID=2496029 RepID=UPI0013DEDA0B|nr:serine hydrolase [Aquabacter cavernae]
MRRAIALGLFLLPLAAPLWGASAQVPTTIPPVVDQPDIQTNDQRILPKIEAEMARGMKMFDVPGVAIGIVHQDKLIYAKGFGTRTKGGAPVDPRTMFQIGSTTKAFLSTTLAMAVDKDVLNWDDRVVILDPSFQLADPVTTREFRVFDLTAQRSGLPPYVNDVMTILGYPEDRLIHSLRYADPVASFRTTFTYTNITHLAAGRMLAHLSREPSWNALVEKQILTPLGMKETTATAEAIRAAPNHAEGHRWTPKGSVQIPFDSFFPYALGPAGNLNSNVEDMARWLRLQIADGEFEGKTLVSRANLLTTRMAKVGMTETISYGEGWVISQTPRGRVIWHNGGTSGFSAHVGFLPDYGVGIVVLANLQNQGFPDALAMTAYDLILENPPTDHLSTALDKAKADAEQNAAAFVRPEQPTATPDLARLAGPYESAVLGPATLAVEGGRAVLTLADTSARIALEPFDGAVFIARLLPDGRFRSVMEMAGHEPMGFLAFAPDSNGKLTRLDWLYTEGQTYSFQRR